jgi:hypothetical protein
MGVYSPWKKPRKEHSDTSAAKIDLVLGDTDFPRAKLDHVREAIRTHMFCSDGVAGIVPHQIVPGLTVAS